MALDGPGRARVGAAEKATAAAARAKEPSAVAGALAPWYPGQVGACRRPGCLAVPELPYRAAL